MAKRRPNVTRFVLALAVSVAVAEFAALGVNQVMGAYHRRLEALRANPEDLVEVAVAGREIAMGALLREADVSIVAFSPKTLGDTPYLTVGQAVGRVTVERLIPNEPIRPERLAAAGTGNSLDAILPTGMRAVSVNLENAAAGSGLVAPGDRVDVLSTLLREEDVVRGETTILLRSIKVLAIGDVVLRIEPTRGEEVKEIVASQVTLQVTPAEAQLLAFADGYGPLLLSLCGAAEASEALATLSTVR